MSVITLPRQLALPFPTAPHYLAGQVLPAPSNADALAWLGRTESWPTRRLAVWGQPGAGKTHLLHGWARRTGARVLDGAALRVLPPITGPLAIDDADSVPRDHLLLHGMNAMAEAGHPLLLSGRAPPARWDVALPDLASRLRAMAAVELRAAEDGLLRALLARLLADRQLAVSEGVQDWLLTRLPRTAAAVREAACRLDHLALAAGRPVTRAIAAHVAATLEDEENDTFETDHGTASPQGATLL